MGFGSTVGESDVPVIGNVTLAALIFEQIEDLPSTVLHGVLASKGSADHYGVVEGNKVPTGSLEQLTTNEVFTNSIGLG